MTDTRTSAKRNGSDNKSRGNGSRPAAAAIPEWQAMMSDPAEAMEAMLEQGLDFVTGLTRINEEAMAFAEAQMKNGAETCRSGADPAAAFRVNTEIARASASKSLELAGRMMSLIARTGGANLIAFQDVTRPTP
ncbi:MAG: hypothetical protein WCF16_10300 [Alphaproteobacteria bacterium]